MKTCTGARRHPGDPWRTQPRRCETPMSTPCTRRPSTSGSAWDVRSGSATDEATERFYAARVGAPTVEPFSTDNRWKQLDTTPPIAFATLNTPTPRTVAWLIRRKPGRGRLRHQAAGIDEERRALGPARGGRVARRVAVERTSSRASSNLVMCGGALRGPGRWPGHAGNAVSNCVPEGSRGSARSARWVTDGRFSGAILSAFPRPRGW